MNRLHFFCKSLGFYMNEREGMKQTTGTHTDTMRLYRVEGDASDNNFAVMQQNVEADGPCCHEREGMKQTTPIHNDTMRFRNVEGEALDKSLLEKDRTMMSNISAELRLQVTVCVHVACICLLNDRFNQMWTMDRLGGTTTVDCCPVSCIVAFVATGCK